MSQKYHIDSGPLGFVSDNGCHMAVLRGHTRFAVTVKVSQVRNTVFGKELLQQIETWKGCPWGRSRDKPLLDLFYQHCLPLFERLAPQTSLVNLSLERFLHSPTYNLELFEGESNTTYAKGEKQCLYTPAFFTMPIRTGDLPEMYQAAPRFEARNIYIAPILDEGESLDSIQGRVLTKEGSPFYFKPRVDMRGPEFERELYILSRIKEAGLTARLRVPKLEGIVVSGDDTMGILLTLIEGTHLRSPDLQDRHELHEKWEVQVRAIVKELHAHDIVWGDVHPMNILIDKAMNAWAIDFGGMNNVEFVDDEKRETVEGDWQGVSRIFRDWLPKSQ